MIAALIRRFGVAELPRIQAAVQEAGLRALERWSGAVPLEDGTRPPTASSDPTAAVAAGRPHDDDAAGTGCADAAGLARSPALAHEIRALEGWLVRVAHNALVDELRRERRHAPLSERPEAAEAPPEPALDDELCSIFWCCHPELPRAAQIALTLRVVYGFDTAQIARAFLSDERTIAQRIVRAKQRLRDAGTRFELPEQSEIPARLAPILDVLYQLFTEGYAATAADAGTDQALCVESLRLARLLTDDARWTSPSAEALRALFCFHLARAETRHADDGSLLLLHEQDRARWDPSLLAEGFTHLGRSARGDSVSRFHLEAGIAACHARAASYASTDWGEIVALYDMLRQASPSPIVDVNRALAIAMLRGATAGLDELDAIVERDLVARYPYALATYAELHASLGNMERAVAYLDRALEEQTSPAERALLRRKRAALMGGADRR